MQEHAIDFDPPFVGRVDHLRKLETAWKSRAIFGIFGVRAVGKSRFVKEFLRRNSKHLGLNKGANLIHIDLKMFETTVETLIHLVYSSLGLMPDTDAINKGKWKEHIASEVSKKLIKCQVLTLWLDNAEDALDLDKNVHDQLLSLCVLLVQYCRGIKIILTSTTKFLFTQIRRAYFQLELPPMTKPEIIELLEAISPDVNYGDFAGPIADQCEGLPQLAIMAGSELSEDGRLIEPGELFELLVENRLRVLSREYYPEEDRVADVYSKFLQRLPEVYQRRLAVLNYIPGSFNAIEARDILGYDKVSTVKDQTLIPIRRRYVLNYDGKTGRFNIQGILRNCLDSYFKWINIPAVRRRYCNVFTKVMKEVSEEMGTVDYARALARFSAEQPNFQKLLTEVIYSEEDIYTLFIEVADSCTLLLERFFSKESERFYKGCLDLATKYGNIKDLAKVNTAYGSLYTNGRGEFRVGEKHYQCAIDILKDVGDCQELAVVNQRMGWSLFKQGRHHESLRFLEASNKASKSLGLEQSALFLTNLTSLGVVHNAMGNFERAKNYHFKTLKWRLKTQGSCHPGVGATYNNIGLLYNETGRPDLALVYFQKGLEVKINSKAILRSVVFSMNNIANQYCTLKQYTAAETMLHDALRQLSDNGNCSKDALSLTYDTLGKVFLAQKKYAEAENVLEKAVEIRQDIMPDGVPFVESAMHLAQAYFGLNRLSDAKVFIDKALKLKAKCINEMPQSTIVVESVELLADIYSQSNNVKKRVETLGVQCNELIRLSNFFETKNNSLKCEDMQVKLNACQCTLNELKSIPLAQCKEEEHTQCKRSNISEVTQEQGDSRGCDKHNVHCNFGRDRELNILSEPNQEWKSSKTQVSGDTMTDSMKSKSAKAKEDYFDNFCKQWNFKQNDKSLKSTATKKADVQNANTETAEETNSYCVVCGRHSFIDNRFVTSYTQMNETPPVKETNIPNFYNLFDSE